MRATQTTTFRSLQSFLDKTSDRMNTLTMQVATGKRLNRASDDPTAISPILSAKTQLLSADRYILTMSSGLDKVQNTDGYLANAEEVMQRTKELAINGVNSSLSAADKATLAQEVALLKDQLLATANAQVGGNYLFSGYAIKTAPFIENPDFDPARPPHSISNPPDPSVDNPPVLYQGDAGKLNLEVGTNEQLEVAIDGGRLFLGLEDADGSGRYEADETTVGYDAFLQLAALEYNLRNDDSVAINVQLDDLDASADQFRKYRSILGTVGKRLETSMDRMETIKIDQKSILSRYEDVDLVAAITSLQQQEASFEAALNVTSRVSELTILKYL